MSATPIPLATKDNAQGLLASGVNASVLSIPLQAGHGARFPQPYTGSCTSPGSSATLNSTGIGAAVGGSAVVGKIIWNKTDGSVAVIKSVATDAVTTTRLLGGSDQTWQASDIWCIDPFVATLTKVDADGNITQYEEILVTARATDTFAVPTGSRGFNNTSANTFAQDDLVNLFDTSPVEERLKDILSVLGVQADTNVTAIATNASDIDNVESNASFYVAAGGSSNAFTGTLAALPAAYATGEKLSFKANHTITGAATFNRASLGAKTIKKVTTSGLVDLATGDLQSGGIYEVEYDGTYYQLLTPVANVVAQKVTALYVATGLSNQAGASSTSETDVTFGSSVGSLTVGAGTLAVGDVIRLKGQWECSAPSGTRTVKFYMGANGITVSTLDESPMDFTLEGTVESVGSSGTVRWQFAGVGATSTYVTVFPSSAAAGVMTINTTGSLAMKFTNTCSISNSSNWVQFRRLKVTKEQV